MTAGILALLTAGMLVWFALYNVTYADGAAVRSSGLVLENVVGGVLGAVLLLVAAGFTVARRISGAWTLFALCVLYVVMTVFVAPLLRGTSLGVQLEFVLGFEHGDGVAIGLAIIFSVLTAIAALIAAIPNARAVHQRQPAAPVPTMPASPPVQPRPGAYVSTQAGGAEQPSGTAAERDAYQELRSTEPRTIGDYRLLGRIGSGGMGTVYLARREGASTQVALKTLNPDLLDRTELLRRFEREAEVLAMVPGAYTARVLDSGVDAGRPYLAMELLDGRPLDAYLQEQGPIRSREALRALALALAVALSGVHRLGLVHRDLKPANIMMTTAGPRLLDFGIATIVDGTRLTRTGGAPGTLTYMAPEQFADEPVGPAADIWAWACCVVCAAHGVSPFTATSTGAVIRRIVETGPQPDALEAVRAVDPALAGVVGQALTTDVAGRPADGAAIVDLLTAGQGPTPTVLDAAPVHEQITQGWRTLPL